MILYTAVCQYIWCDKKRVPKHWGLSTNKPFINQKDALKELRHAAEEAIFEMQEWSTACEKDQYPEIPVTISCWCSINGKLKEISQSVPLNKATLPNEKITRFDIQAENPMYFWSGYIDKQEIEIPASQNVKKISKATKGFSDYRSSKYKPGKYLSEIMKDSSHDLSYKKQNNQQRST